MDYLTKDMIEKVIAEKVSVIRTSCVLGVILLVIAVWLIVFVPSAVANVFGIPAAIIAFIIFRVIISLLGNIAKFKKYIPFYDRGDVFLAQIAEYLNVSTTFRISEELKQLVKEKMLKDVIIVEKTGQVLIASSVSATEAKYFDRYCPYYNKGELPISMIVSGEKRTVDEIHSELYVLVRFGAIEVPIFDEDKETISIQTITREKSGNLKESLTGDKKIDDLLKEGRESVAKLHHLHKSISDEQVQEKISEIISITDKIFKRLWGDPDCYNHVKRFANYYLPKSLKLLKSYEECSRSTEQGENVIAILDKINSALDPLIAGFRGIYDSMYLNKVYDIETDIKMLDMMMKKDGLQD